MDQTRRARLESVALSDLSLILKTVKDPRVSEVFFSRVELSEDAQNAIIFVSCLELGEKRSLKLETALEGLKSASGYLRKKLGETWSSRYTPELRFKVDLGIENTATISSLLNQIKKESK